MDVKHLLEIIEDNRDLTWVVSGTPTGIMYPAHVYRGSNSELVISTPEIVAVRAQHGSPYKPLTELTPPDKYVVTVKGSRECLDIARFYVHDRKLNHHSSPEVVYYVRDGMTYDEAAEMAHHAAAVLNEKVRNA